MTAPPSRSPAAGPPPPVALSVAGSDPSGGAGVQADLKTFHTFGVYGAAVITSLTVQNTTAVLARTDVDPDVVVRQLAAVRDDLDVAAAKTGLLGGVAQVEALALYLRRQPLAPLVVDPVLVATAGQRLTADGVAAALRRALLPLATLVTPNLDEAAALLGRPVDDVPAMHDAARALVDLGARAALVTGGHLRGAACDVLCADGAVIEFSAPRIPGGPAHGTGCSLSAAITAGLARGLALARAVDAAKRWLTRALAAAPAIGHGHRPVDHRVRPDEP